ncbi:MAG: hypothetical protein ABI670_22810 [Chloroflexota bacterium]
MGDTPTPPSWASPLHPLYKADMEGMIPSWASPLHPVLINLHESHMQEGLGAGLPLLSY